VTAVLASGADAIFVGWRDNSTNEDGFEVNATFNGQAAAYTPTVSANVTAFTWSDVWAGPTFCFRIRALNYVAGHSGWSAQACVSTAHLVPAAPSNLHLTPLGGGVVRLEWTDNANNEDGFRVSRYGTIPYRTVPADSTSYDWADLSTGTEACFTVSAFNTHATSTATGRVCITVA